MKKSKRSSWSHSKSERWLCYLALRAYKNWSMRKHKGRLELVQSRW
nr:MAG TPA: hypothetical protein [Caudoviricetes sp.]